MNRIALLVPLVLFFAFIGVGVMGLATPKGAIVHQTGKPMPELALPRLEQKGMLQASALKGQWLLVNFFASWCTPCLAEHAFLKTLPARGLTRIGIAYKDKPENINRLFDKRGNPYHDVGVDREGMAAIDWGVTGVPESFLINPQGMIVAHFAGPLTPEVWDQNFAPLLPEGK